MRITKKTLEIMEFFTWVDLALLLREGEERGLQKNASNNKQSKETKKEKV